MRILGLGRPVAPPGTRVPLNRANHEHWRHSVNCNVRFMLRLDGDSFDDSATKSS
jgi:hypothetical protein